MLDATAQRAVGTSAAGPTIATVQAAAMAAVAEGDVDLALRWLESALAALAELDDFDPADTVNLILARDHALRGIGLFQLADALRATALQTLHQHTGSADAATLPSIGRLSA